MNSSQETVYSISPDDVYDGVHDIKESVDCYLPSISSPCLSSAVAYSYSSSSSLFALCTYTPRHSAWG
jgi:hypothetical protein